MSGMQKSKKTKIILPVIVFLCTVIFAVLASANPTGTIENNEKLAEIPIRTGELRLIEERKDIAGNVIQIWEDDKYSYHFDVANNDVRVISANTERMEAIVKSAGDLSIGEIPNVDTDISGILKDFFSEYDLDSIKTEIDTESGNPIEWFEFTVKEYYKDILQNTAHISLSYDGQLTFLQGSRNTIDKTKDYWVYNEQDVVELAFKYILSKKDDWESDINSELKNPGEAEYFIATEEMVVPDGVKIGEEFKTERLPQYEIYLNSIDDMKVSDVEKMVYGDTVAWLVEFSVNTSWGNFDEVLNPFIHLYIDATTGEVLEMNSTDAG